MTRMVSMLALMCISQVLRSQLLLAGPMLGTVALNEAHVWAQFSIYHDEIGLTYWEKENPANLWRVAAIPNEAYGFTCQFVLGDLQPGTTYEYRLQTDANKDEVYSFRTQPLWAWRTDPPSITIAMGSCAYINEESRDRPGKPYGGDYQIFNAIATKKPDVMLWLGDNVYFREGDWDNRSGMVHRYSHSRSLPELQNLLSSCANYAIWDDHDYGPNDADRSFIHKDEALSVFKKFWMNPSYGIPGTLAEHGITSQFTWGDIDVFLLDNRSFRSSPDIEGLPRQVLGDDQVNWLIQALKYSKAPFKLVAVGGQFLNPVAKYENMANYPEERQRILDLIALNKIQGVIFLSGDRHFTELSRVELPGGAVVHDLTVSSLTSTAYNASDEANTLRVEGTHTPQRNFATLTFSGERKQRVMTIRVFDSDGNQLWERIIPSA